MFKDGSNVKLEDSHFSVGSTFLDCNGGKHILVAYQKNCVGIVSLTTFQFSTKFLTVIDQNHLTKSEAQQLIGFLDLNHTFSDFSLHPKGLKTLVYPYSY